MFWGLKKNLYSRLHLLKKFLNSVVHMFYDGFGVLQYKQEILPQNDNN